ncbi:MAG: hypothetical protein IJ106_04350 [Parasporobacterium sp.]|nr:hypothetical protein [Parasporobacterium sp.]
MEADTMRILCGANYYEQKFYLNPAYDALPQVVKDELKILCVLFVQEVSGIIILEFSEEGDLRIVVTHNEDDFYFDEIGSELKIREMREKNRELFEQLEAYYDALCG